MQPVHPSEPAADAGSPPTASFGYTTPARSPYDTATSTFPPEDTGNGPASALLPRARHQVMAAPPSDPPRRDDDTDELDAATTSAATISAPPAEAATEAAPTDAEPAAEPSADTDPAAEAPVEPETFAEPETDAEAETHASPETHANPETSDESDAALDEDREITADLAGTGFEPTDPQVLELEDTHPDATAPEATAVDEPVTASVADPGMDTWGSPAEAEITVLDDYVDDDLTDAENDVAEEPPTVAEPPAAAEPALAEPAHAEAAPAEAAVVGAAAGLRPGDVPQTRMEVWSIAAAQGFRDEWSRIAALFVEDPDTALDQARSLVGGAVQALADALLAEQVDIDPRAESVRPDTETMRVAMRRYREFLDRLLAL